MLRSFFPQYTTSGSPLVGGSGTLNTVPKWSVTGSTLANSTVTDDGTTVALGSVFKVTAASGNVDTSAGSVTWALAAGTSALNVASGLFNLDTTNSRVGVNTTLPLAEVHVVKSGAASNVFVDAYGNYAGVVTRRADGTSGAPTAVQANELCGIFGMRAYGATGFSASIRASMSFLAAENWTDAAQGSYVTFATTPIGSVTRTEVMRITDVGNVGIGTASPGSKLAVVGGAISQYLASGDNLGVSVLSGGTSYNSYIRLSNGTQTVDYGQGNGAAFVNANNSQPWYVATGGAERMRIDASGNVGIGVTPSTRLDVSSSTGSRIRTDVSSAVVVVQTITNPAANAYVTSRTDASDYQIYISGGQKVTIDTNGNVYTVAGTTSMTYGFFYIPAAAGAPTGVPTAVSGRLPMYYDSTNNKFYVYNGAWKGVTLA